MGDPGRLISIQELFNWAETHRVRTWGYRKFIGMVLRNCSLRCKDSGERTQIWSKRADLELNGRRSEVNHSLHIVNR